MKASVEIIVLVCVIAGTLTACAGLWYCNVAAFCVGIMVGGFLPMLVAELFSRRM